MTRPASALLALAVLVLGAFWFLRPADEAQAVDPVLSQGERVTQSFEGATLEGGSRASSASRLELPVSVDAVRVAGAGQISGTVRDRASGAGVADVGVALFSYPPQGAEFVRRIFKLSNDVNLGERFKPVARVRTDSAGRFLASGVLPGKYYVQAVGEFHVPDPIERVVVAPGGSDVDLWVRGGAKVTGTVRLADGTPAVGAVVHVGHGESQFIPAMQSGDITERRTTTDGRGRFEVGGLPPSAGMQVTAVDAQHGIAFAQGLELSAGQTLDVALAFAPPASLVGRAVSVASPGDPEGAPLAGVELAAVPRGLREMQFVDALMEASHATSAADGAFRLSPLAPGTLDVLAWAPGHRPARVGPIPSEGGVEVPIGVVELERGQSMTGRVVDSAGQPVAGAQVRWEPFLIQGQLDLSFAAFLTQAVPGFTFPETDAEGRFEAGPFPNATRQRLYVSKPGFQMASKTWRASDPAEFVVTLRRGGSLAGRVVDRVTGAPVTRFVIRGGDRIDQDNEAPSALNPFGSGQVVEDAEGRFEVPAVRAGGAELVFEAEGYLARRVRDLVVAEGEALTDVVVELDRGAIVRGVVVDGAGLPVPGARVVVQRGDAGNVFIELRRDFESGRRRVGGGPPPNFAAEEFQSNLPRGVLAFGVGLGIVESSTTDAEGRFELVGVGRGEWTALGHHRDFAEGASDAIELDWPEGTPAPEVEGVTVEMSRGATLKGTVRDRRGEPQAGVMVLAFSPAALTTAANSGGAYQGESKGDGSYAIPNMVGGGYFLMVTRSDEHLDPFSFLSTMQLELVVVPSEGELERDLVDQSAATTRVHGVVSEGGRPVAGGSLMALSSEGAGLLGVDFKVAAVGLDGSYAFPGLPPGDYRMRYIKRGRPRMMAAAVPDRPEVRLDLALPGAVIAGEVVRALDGKGLGGVFVEARRLDDDFALGGLLGTALQSGLRPTGARSGGDGGFEIGGLEPGRYAVEVSASGTRGGGLAFEAAQAVEVTLGPDERLGGVRLELSEGVEVRGFVTDEGGLPVEGARLSAWVPAADGGGAGGGAVAGAAGGSVAGGGETGGTSASGSVAGGAGGGAPLAPSVIDPRDITRGRSDANGDFALQGVAAGALRVSVSHPDFAPLEAVAVEASANMQPLELVLRPGTEVVVRVFDATGRPAYGATARLNLEGAPEVAGDAQLMEWFAGRGVVGLDGTAKLGAFAPGSYRLEVTRGADRFVQPSIAIEGGLPTELEAHFE